VVVKAAEIGPVYAGSVAVKDYRGGGPDIGAEMHSALEDQQFAAGEVNIHCFQHGPVDQLATKSSDQYLHPSNS
tara:strand:- start:16 stop:237 length:222 start_codon:yes stop_codon:yes gene_type:complete